jgi:hypothetical protein
MDWADSRKTRSRVRASCAKVAALALTAASTVVLRIPAIPAIPDRTAIALPMVALVTLITALEPFFNRPGRTWACRAVLPARSWAFSGQGPGGDACGPRR